MFQLAAMVLKFGSTHKTSRIHCKFFLAPLFDVQEKSWFFTFSMTKKKKNQDLESTT